MHAASPLEGYGLGEWVCFERALVVRDIFTGGTRTFLSQRDAQVFRARLYAQYGTASMAAQSYASSSSSMAQLSCAPSALIHVKIAAASLGYAILQGWYCAFLPMSIDLRHPGLMAGSAV